MQDGYTEGARGELKRVDHLVYVSLKFTRTVDVIRSILQRLIDAIEYLMVDLIVWKQEEKEEEEIPKTPAGKTSKVKEFFSDDERIMDLVNFYLRLRKILRQDYECVNEFRRHVGLITKLDGERINIGIDECLDYYKRVIKDNIYIEDLINPKDSDF